MFVVPFGHMSHAGRDAPDAAELAEDAILWVIERSKICAVDTGDVASLLALELIASLAAYNRAPLPVSWRRSRKPHRPARRSCATPTGAARGRRH